MSAPLAVRPQNKILAAATAAGVGLLAMGGFTLSFTALRELAQREFAIAPQLSFIYPLVIDGFIVIATAAAFTMKKRGPRVTWYPWAAMGVFGALSVLGNAAHAIDNPDATFPSWVSALGASVPAVALLIASHLLVMMIDGKTQSHGGSRKKATTERPSVAASVELRPRVAEQPATPVAETVRLHAVEPPIESTEPDGLVSRLEALAAQGEPITGALIGRLEGVSERTGRRRLAALQESHPELFGETELEATQ